MNKETKLVILKDALKLIKDHEEGDNYHSISGAIITIDSGLNLAGYDDVYHLFPSLLEYKPYDRKKDDIWFRYDDGGNEIRQAILVNTINIVLNSAPAVTSPGPDEDFYSPNQ